MKTARAIGSPGCFFVYTKIKAQKRTKRQLHRDERRGKTKCKNKRKNLSVTAFGAAAYYEISGITAYYEIAGAFPASERNGIS